MANIPLKSIKFPGLSDTYIVPQIDNTLTTAGKAADAKKTGDELSDLKSAFDSILNVYALPAGKYTQGRYRQDTGIVAGESSNVRCYDYISDDVVYVRSNNDSISLILAAWNGQGAYQGWYNGNFAKSGAVSLYRSINFADIRNRYPDYQYKIMAQKTGITVAEAANAIDYYQNDIASTTDLTNAISTLADEVNGEIANVESDVGELTKKQNSIIESTHNLIDIILMESETISVNNNVVSGTASNFKTKFSAGIPISTQLDADQQYTISFEACTGQEISSTGNGLKIVFNYSDGTSENETLLNSDANFTPYSLTSESGKSLSKINFDFGSAGNNVWYLKNLQLEKGNTITAYVPHYTAVDVIAREQNADTGNISGEGALLPIRKLLPDYYFAMPESATSYAANDYMNEKIQAIPEGKHFIFITDCHWKNNNTKNSTAMMKYVKGKVGIKDIFHGGDILNQEVSKYMASARMAEYMNEMRDAFGTNFYSVQGNHDLNVANLSYVLADNPGLTEEDVRLSYRQVYKQLVAPIEDKVVFEDCTEKLTQTGASGDDLLELEAYCKLHYYYDDDKQKIRYIVVCTTNTDNNGVVNTYFGARSLQEMYLQYDWIYQTLLNTPDNYDIVVLGHAFVWSGPEAPTQYRPYMPHDVGIAIGRLLAGVRYKVNVTVRCTSNNVLLNKFYAYGEHTYIFNTDTKRHDIVVGISGDKHFDGAYIIGYNTVIEDARIYDAMSKANREVLITVTLCDARAVPEEDYNDYKPVMTAGTVNEQAFDVVTITDNHTLVYTRFGSGNDRVFQFPAL